MGLGVCAGLWVCLPPITKLPCEDHMGMWGSSGGTKACVCMSGCEVKVNKKNQNSMLITWHMLGKTLEAYLP